MIVRTLLASLLLAAPSLHAQLTLDSLLPAEGTVGTPLDLQLTGDLGKGKPKVWLTLAGDTANKPKKTKLKVSSIAPVAADASSLAASFKKTKTGPGLYDLHVKPKGKGQVEQVFESVFTMRAPEIGKLAPDTAEPKSELMIAGTFFGGPAKPKVSFVPEAGGKAKKGKVKQATGGTLLVVKLPKLAAGIYDVLVSNKVGADTLEDALTIVPADPGGGGNGDCLTVTLSSEAQALLVTQFVAKGPNQPGSVLAAFNQSDESQDLSIVTAGMQVGPETFTFSLSFPFNPGVTPTPVTLPVTEEELFEIAVSQSSPDVNWSGFGGIFEGSITVTSASAQRMAGTFQFTVGPDGRPPAASDLEMTDGEFDVGIQ